MRFSFLCLLSIGGLALAFALAGSASANTTLEISPASGPPGSSVHVIGEGFATDPVQIGMFVCCDLESLPRNSDGLLLNSLPGKDFALLATVTPQNNTFSVDVTLSSAQVAAHGYGKQVYLVAQTPSRGQIFVASQTFTLTAPALAGAGMGIPRRSGLPIRLLSASLAAAGALLLAAGWYGQRPLVE